MRWRFFFWEALASIRSNAATTVAATVTVLIVTFLLGIFVTTSGFTAEAIRLAGQHNIQLIDGQELARLVAKLG